MPKNTGAPEDRMAGPDAKDQPRMTQISYAEFEFLARRAGLILSDEQMAEMHQAYSVIEAMAARIRTPRRPAAEPALTFSVDQTCGR
jgi:hypothetical protein